MIIRLAVRLLYFVFGLLLMRTYTDNNYITLQKQNWDCTKGHLNVNGELECIRLHKRGF